MPNHFEIFGIEPHYFINKDELEKSYFKLQMQYHPDRMAGRSEDEKKAVLAKSADINTGYRILTDDVERANYLLELHGVRVNKEANNSFEPSHALLTEQMELRERASDIETGMDNKAELLSHVEAEIHNAKVEFNRFFGEKDFPNSAEQAMRMKYLSKLKDELERYN